jgi:hypothetical protein
MFFNARQTLSYKAGTFLGLADIHTDIGNHRPTIGEPGGRTRGTKLSRPESIVAGTQLASSSAARFLARTNVPD